MSQKPASVCISICSNCKQHQWCTRHNEATYSSLATEIAKSIQNQDSSIEVHIQKVGHEKMGSFEITCNNTLLFSKLTLGYFPHITGVTNRVIEYVEDYRKGNDLKKYTENQASPVRINSGIKSSSRSSPKKKLKYVPDYKGSEQEESGGNFLLDSAVK